jgi:uncharacterized Ntn-hydrolase superfamily protein
MRQRWFGATGRRVPEIAVEGELDVEGALVLDDVTDQETLEQAHRKGTPVVVRADDPRQVRNALARPEVAAVLVPAQKRDLLELDLTEMTYGTFSIAACDLDAGQWGVATQSKFLAVGSVVPWAEPHVGAVATQAYANPRYGPEGLVLLRQELGAEEVVVRLTEADEGREHRQVGIVDAEGRAASFTGPSCIDWAGGRTGPGYAAQGNILVSGETIDAMAETFESRSVPLAERLIDCLAAAQEAGGDSRGQQSAALLVVEKDGGYAGLSDVLVDLRVDDHERPIEELRRLYGLHKAIFGKTPRDEWVDVEESLENELVERLQTLGYDGAPDEAFFRWAATENLEERVDGFEAIDPIVLEELRRQSE